MDQRHGENQTGYDGLFHLALQFSQFFPHLGADEGDCVVALRDSVRQVEPNEASA